MKAHQTPLPGLLRIEPFVARDARGGFVKTFHEPTFRAWGLRTHFAEEYYSVSQRGVIRGLHFQTPPHDHAKLVYCLAGRVVDAVVDLRVGSPTFGRHALFDLDADSAMLLYIPTGMAHGFCSMTDDAVMVYNVTTPYSRDHDSGIRWDSAGIPWPISDPIVSERDRGFVNLADLRSPFVYEAPSAVGEAERDARP